MEIITFWVNMVVHDMNIEKFKTIFYSLKRLWIQRIRWEFNILKEYTDDEMREIKTIFQELQSHDIQILWALLPQIPWTLSTLLGAQTYRHSLQAFLPVIQTNTQSLIQHFHDYITHRQIWNEANTSRFRLWTPDPKSYVKLVKNMSHIIKTLQTNVKIIIWWLFNNNIYAKLLPWQYPNFLEECLDLWIDQYIDIYAYHPYHIWCYIGRESKETIVHKTQSLIQEFYDKNIKSLNKPLRITEFGISHRRVSLSQYDIARIYSQLIHNNQNYDNFFIWNISDYNDARHSRWNPERYFGLLDHHFRPKRIFMQLKKIISQ